MSEPTPTHELPPLPRPIFRDSGDRPRFRRIAEWFIKWQEEHEDEKR